MKCIHCDVDYLVVTKLGGYRYLHPKNRDHFGRVMSKAYQCPDTLRFREKE